MKTCPALHGQFPARFEQIFGRRERGVDRQPPLLVGPRSGNRKINRLRSGVEQEQKVGLRFSEDDAAEGPLSRVEPFRRAPSRAKPFYVRIAVELFLAQHWVGTAKGNHASREAMDFLIFLDGTP